MKSLERSIGLGAVVAISISAMLGSGIFVLPGLAAAKTGPMVWLAYLAAGLGVLPAALSKSELATAMPTSGGTYVYLERTFGPLAGTVSGIGLWLSLLLKSAFALVGFSAYLSVLVEVPEKPVAIALLLAITALNIVGVSIIGKLQKVIVGIVLFLLIIMSLYGLSTMDLTYLDAGFSKGTTGFIAAAAFVYVSYAGVTKVAAIAEEVKDPGRNLPLGILISWALVMCIYVFVVFVLVCNVPYKELVDHNHTGKPDLAPIYTVAKILGGQTVGYIAAVFAVLTMTSMSVAGLLAASRFPFAMSRDKLLPEKLQVINETFKTPVWCISVTAAAMAISILFFPVEQIAKLASAFMIVAFMFICGTVVVLRESAATWYQPRFRAPFYPILQIIGIITGAVLLWAMGLTSVVAITGICMIGGASYLAYGRYQTSRLGVLGRMGKRKDLVGSNKEAGADEAPHDLDEDLPSEAAVVVPLFGSERSPETLVEMGAALAHHRKLEVLHVTEVPEQMYLADVLEEDHLSIALSRRIHVMAEEEDVNLEYNTTVSHDVVKTIHNVADRLHCEWVVMESASRRTKGITFQNQLGWLQDHLPCNLAVFKDAGVRYIRKILVFAEPGPHDSLVVTTADHLADIYKAELSFVCFVDDNEEPINVQAKVDYVDQLRDLCVNETEIVKLDGYREMFAIEKATEKYDLLIMGAPPPRTFSTRLFGTTKDVLTRKSACSVLWLKTPVEQTHDALNVVQRGSGNGGCDLMQYIDPELVQAKVKVQKKEELFRLATEKIAGKYEDEISPLIINTALWEREQMQVTSVGNGVAMPHATLSRAPTGSSTIAVYTLEKEVDFGAPNGAKVDICFFTMGPPSDRQIHLEILSKLSKMALNSDCLEDLRSAPTPEELYERIRKFCS